MAREVMVPLSAVMALIERQEAFNSQLIDKLGLYIREAAEKYDKALNPPLDSTPDVPMHYSRVNEEEEDIQAALESGLIDKASYDAAMKRLIGDTEIDVQVPAY